MTSVGPDLLLPGVASKKPVPATNADGTGPSETVAADGNFAQELDAVTTRSPVSDASGTEAPTTEVPTKNPATDSVGKAPTASETSSEAAVAAPVSPTDDGGAISTAPIDLAELHLFGPSQQEVGAAVSTSTVMSEGSQTEGTPALIQLATTAPGIDPPGPAANEAAITPGTSLVAPIQPTATPISNDGDDATPDIVVASGDRKGIAAAISDTSLLPPMAGLAPDPVATHETAAADSSQLLSPLAALNGSGLSPLLSQASGQIPSLTSAATPNAPQPQAPNPSLMAANLAIDPQGLGTTDADGDSNANMQSNNKSALRAAASLTSDAKPLEAAGGQTFSSTFSAAASEAANQTARSAAQAAAQRPARPAQTAPATAQVAVHIVRAVADGVSRFNVQLQPAELGRVEVKMEISRDGAVRAMVIADRQETVDQLQRDSRALERALQEAGLKADSQNLHFSLRGGQNGHAMSENRTSIGNSGNGEAEQAEVSESALAVHWSNVAGSTGALDIRV